MANNCLITKLKGSVDNDNLLKFGQFTISINKTDGNECRARFLYNGSQTMDLTGKVELSSGVTMRITENTVYFSGQGKITINDKYNLTYILIDNTGMVIDDLDSIEYCPLDGFWSNPTVIVNGNLSSFGKIITLTTLNLNMYEQYNDVQIVGEISDLKNLSNLTFLNIAKYHNVTGTMKELSSYYPLLTNLDFIGHIGITGSFEDYVAMKVVQSKTTGTLAVRGAKYSSITFKDAIGQNSSQESVSWEPYNGNTKITFEGVDTVISIDAQGNWTRIS